MRNFRLGLICMAALAVCTLPGAAVAEDYNWNPDVGPLANHDVFLWDDANNWMGGAVPVDGNSIYVRGRNAPLPANIIMDLDIEGGVFLPNSDARFASNKLDLVSVGGGGGGTLTLKSIDAQMAGGYRTTFHVPVVVDTFTATAAAIGAGGSLDANTLVLKDLVTTGAGTITLGEVSAVATGGRSRSTISSPLTAKVGGTGNTLIKGVGYTSTVDGGVLAGGTQDIVTIDQYLDNNRTAGGSSLTMTAQTVMPSMINVAGVTSGLVISDANTAGLVYSGSPNVTFGTQAAFRDQSDGGNPNTGGTYPTPAELGGNLLWYAVDSLGNKATTYTLANNTADGNSPFKGFGIGVWSTNSNGRATLQMGPGDTGNMQVMLALPSTNYSAYTDDDLTFKHNGEAGASTTADFWVEIGGKFSKFNGQAITNGETNLIDTFHFHAMRDGMRISQHGQSYAGQTWIYDAGRLATGNPAGVFQGHMKFINGGAFWFDGTVNASATTKLTFEADSWLSINDPNSLENLTLGQIDFAEGAVLSYRNNLDTDAIGANLAEVIAKAEFRVGGTRTFDGTGLELGTGHYLGGRNGGGSDENIYGTVVAAPGDDLHIAAFGREFRLYGTFDAGAEDLVCGSTTVLPTGADFTSNHNGTGVAALVYEVPDGRVDIRDEATIYAGGLKILSGNVRLWQDLNLARLHIQSGANLNFFSSPAPVVTVTDTLSGGGNWSTAGGSVVLAGGAKVAPGDSVGTLNSGGGELIMESGAIYEWEIASATGTPGTEWDLLMASNITFEGDLIFKVLDAGLAGDLDGSEEFIVASVTGTIDDALLGVTFDLPGWSGGSLAVVGKDLVLTGLTTSLIGDADGNGVVNAADYIILKTNMGTGTGAGAAAGDFDGDGNVDWTDLQLLQDHYGEGSGASGTIPEPATLGLLAVGAMALIRRRRRS